MIMDLQFGNLIEAIYNVTTLSSHFPTFALTLTAFYYVLRGS